MEVHRGNFSERLPTILKRIADSDFIAFDLELSGIPNQRRRQTRNTSSKATLQQRYAEIKDAAEKYQILQVGLTCVEQDPENGRYLVRPMNFHLSPLMPEEMGERDFTFSSGAVGFLLNNAYRIQDPFEIGIPYLTRKETAVAEQQARMKNDKSGIPDIVLAESDNPAKDFVERVTQEIKTWKETKKPEPGYFNVFGRTRFGTTTQERALNRFEMRLVHQTVRGEFPDLVTYGRSDCVSVQWRDEADEMEARNAREIRSTGDINRQVGFRWVAEALAGGDLSNAYLAMSMNDRRFDGEVPPNSWKGFTRRLEELYKKLNSRKKVLVGHNCFLDLVYLYKIFYGDLPEYVEGFQRAMLDTFPLVFDTKYMSTAGIDSRFRSAQLWQLEEALAKHQTPKFYTPSDQKQYENEGQYHKAGYDSFVTAKVFLRLAARLETMAKTGDEMLLQHHQPNSKIGLPPKSVQQQDENTAPVGTETSTSPVNFTPVARYKKRKKSRSKSSKTDEPAQGKFSHLNMFDRLREAPQDNQDSQVAEAETAPSAIAENPASSANTIKPTSTAEQSGPDDQGLVEKMETLQLDESRQPADESEDGMLPTWDTSFWNVYKNKLRVYGTVEAVCDLEAPQKPEGTDGDEQKEDQAKKSGKEDSWLSRAKRFLAREMDKT